MPILPNVGRKTGKMRSVTGLIYALLIAGSITMIYPFLIMLSGSIKGNADVDVMDAIPRVLYSEKMRFARFQEDRYGSLTLLSAAYSRELLRNSQASLPTAGNPEAERDNKKLKDYTEFLQRKADDFPAHFYVIQEMVSDLMVRPRNYRRFLNSLRAECGSIETFNRKYDSTFSSWNDFSGVLDTPLTKEFTYEKLPLTDRYLAFKRSLPIQEKVVLNLDGYYFSAQTDFPQVRNGEARPSRILYATRPSGREGQVWEEFVKHHLNCIFIRLDGKGLKLLRIWLSKKFQDGVVQMNKVNDTAYPSFNAVYANSTELRNDAFFVLYTEFVTDICPSEHLIVDTPSTRYRKYIGDPSATIPVVAYDYAVFKEMKRSFMTEILTRNYLNVIQYIAIYGRAIFNTMVFIGLSMLAALIVNPLAAYALSRFNLKNTYTILMFFLGTMAFPGAVTMIPNFLLLKQFHLLNTFWALILPGVANGYSIFILKGFFDSIPREVYESAMIDGASEWTMFWKFTMALSKPILALITLGAFTAAYTAFMFALIICPDEKMWTLMVWLYQLQQGAHQSVIYTALVLAAVPTLLVFVLAQNTIMKGIVIPVEK